MTSFYQSFLGIVKTLRKNTEFLIFLFFSSPLHIWICFIRLFTPVGWLLALTLEVECVISMHALLHIWGLILHEARDCPVLLQWKEEGADCSHFKSPSLDRRLNFSSSFLSLISDTTWEKHPHRTVVRIAALFIIARTWKQPRCPSADEWIRKLWYKYTMEYYSAIKKKYI